MEEVTIIVGEYRVSMPIEMVSSGVCLEQYRLFGQVVLSGVTVEEFKKLETIWRTGLINCLDEDAKLEVLRVADFLEDAQTIARLISHYKFAIENDEQILELILPRDTSSEEVERILSDNQYDSILEKQSDIYSPLPAEALRLLWQDMDPQLGDGLALRNSNVFKEVFSLTLMGTIPQGVPFDRNNKAAILWHLEAIGDQRLLKIIKPRCSRKVDPKGCQHCDMLLEFLEHLDHYISIPLEEFKDVQVTDPSKIIATLISHIHPNTSPYILYRDLLKLAQRLDTSIYTRMDVSIHTGMIEHKFLRFIERISY